MKSEITNTLFLTTCIVYTVLIFAGAIVTRVNDGLNDYAFLLLIFPSIIIPWLMYMPYKATQVIGLILVLVAINGVRAALNYEFPKVWTKGDFYFLSLMFMLFVSVGLRIYLWIRG